MLVTIYIAYFFITIINTWYLTTQLKLKKELITLPGSLKQLKDLRINIRLCMFIYLIDILFVVITSTVT
ncbi:hypothetical protein DF41_23345 [Raoultella planticola]|nr:hypothetical protein DF41_23345 [Raoultella planticola]